MDVAVVHPFLYTKGGAERVVLRIARAFDATVFVSRYAPEKTFPEFGDLDVQVLPSKLRWFVPPFLPRRVRDAVVAGHQFYQTKLPGDFDVVNAQGTPSQWIRHRNEPVVWYCLHEDTWLLTCDERGYAHTRIRNLRVGDLLPSMDASGCVSLTRIKKISRRSSESTGIVRLRNGREILATPDHRFFVWDGEMWVVKRRMDLAAGDLIPVPSNIPEKKVDEVDVVKLLSEEFGSHPYWGERLFRSLDGKQIAIGYRKGVTLPSMMPVSKELMRILGYYVSEGYTYQRHAEKRQDMQMVLTFGIHERETLVEDCIRCSEKVFGISPKVRKREKRVEWVLTFPNAVAMVIQAMGCGRRARDKRIPRLVFNVSNTMKKEFVHAYMLGDGHEYKKSKRHRAVTVSEELANGLLYLLSFLGKQGAIIRRRARKFNDYQQRLDHQIYSLTYHRDGFRYVRYQHLGEVMLVPVKEVMPLGEKAVVYDLEVGGNHSFLAGDAIFTHNCHTPNREAFDLYDWRMKRRNVLQKLFYWSAIQPYRVIEPRVVPSIEHIFANSRNTQERISHYLGVDSEILSPGVDYEDFYCSGFEKFFFYPSRITPEKRFEYAIKAFKEFKKTHPGWRLVIAGALVRERGEHVAYYERLKQMLGSDGDILVDVPWSRLRELYATCTAVVYTPVNEDFGIIPLEAAASAKPVVAVNEGGPREVVVEGTTGFLVDSVAGLAGRMAYLADHPGEAEKMGEAGRRRVKEHYSWERFLGRFGQALKESAKR